MRNFSPSLRITEKSPGSDEVSSRRSNIVFRRFPFVRIDMRNNGTRVRLLSVFGYDGATVKFSPPVVSRRYFASNALARHYRYGVRHSRVCLGPYAFVAPDTADGYVRFTVRRFREPAIVSRYYQK